MTKALWNSFLIKSPEQAVVMRRFLFIKYRIAMHSLLLFCCYYSSFSQPVSIYINELQAINTSSVLNPIDGTYSDWIELHNKGTEGINITGWLLTDDPSFPDKWRVPFDSIIPPDGYMIFWADGRDEFAHTNFKLSRSGEFIGLYDPEGNAIDSVFFGYQEEDYSYGRAPDNMDQWVYFDQVTPGTPNYATYFSGKCSDPAFSLEGGVYSGQQTITLFHAENGVSIYYSVDGTVPDTGGKVYSGRIVIDTTTVLRVRAYKAGFLPGRVITQTYFIDETVNLPLVSLVTDPEHFFSDSTGIYVIGKNGIPGYCSDIPMNLNRDWERPVNVELYDQSGKPEINQLAGVKIFGGCSRTRYPQKSLALYARSEYGKGSFDCQIFKDKPIYQFESFILRNSADDCTYTMFKDPMGQTILRDMDLDLQAYRPAVVYINGVYWGIHNIREKINEHYPAGNYRLDSDDINLLKNNPQNEWNVSHGSADEYNKLIHYVSNQNMEDERIYHYVTTKMDMNNYIDYQIAQIYLSANDWPGNNIKFWNTNEGPHNRWRWIVYDLDNCLFDF